MKKTLLIAVLALGGIAVAIALVVGSGSYNVAADDEHSPAVYRLLATARDRSISVRAARIDVPELADPQRITRGAGNYDAMCVGCHLKPGADETEISRGLYPRPPDLSSGPSPEAQRAFWVIKHGIKATGMPSWGKSMDDEYIWDMVAFLGRLPQMNAEQYAAEVHASAGHSHGGREQEHSHDGEGHSHEEPDQATSASDEHAEALPSAVAASEPLAVVKAFHDALTAGSAAKVQATLDPKVLIMESGNVERSRQEYASHHLPADLKFMSAVHYRLERQTGDAVGDLAWAASEARLAGESDGKPVDVISTESLVLRKTAAGWKIVHIHWSSRNARKA